MKKYLFMLLVLTICSITASDQADSDLLKSELVDLRKQVQLLSAQNKKTQSAIELLETRQEAMFFHGFRMGHDLFEAEKMRQKRDMQEFKEGTICLILSLMDLRFKNLQQNIKFQLKHRLRRERAASFERLSNLASNVYDLKDRLGIITNKKGVNEKGVIGQLQIDIQNLRKEISEVSDAILAHCEAYTQTSSELLQKLRK